MTNKGLTPLEKITVRIRNFLTGFTLTELLVVIIILGILAALALPNFLRSKEHTLTNEAIASLKLISAAEKIYRMENNGYYPYSAGTESTVSNINTTLRLFLPTTSPDWNYSITTTGSPSTTFAATATRSSGIYSSCQYDINNTTDEPVPAVPANCP